MGCVCFWGTPKLASVFLLVSLYQATKGALKRRHGHLPVVTKGTHFLTTGRKPVAWLRWQLGSFGLRLSRMSQNEGILETKTGVFRFFWECPTQRQFPFGVPLNPQKGVPSKKYILIRVD